MGAARHRKTTLAHLLAEATDRPFYKLSAINNGVKDVREVLNKAKNSGSLFTPQQPLLFIDEIHRFSKSQQDALLEAVEKGWVTLIGATTENPSFEMVPAVLSRCQVYVLRDLNREHLVHIVQNAMAKDSYLGLKNIELTDIDALLKYSGGDARRLLNLFELIVEKSESETIKITAAAVEEVAQEVFITHQKSGDDHYDLISAFIKTIRGSDPNAAVYWLARLIAVGEEPKFIARRLLILASEDIGNANPTALVLANNTMQAVQQIGYPEARIIPSQCTIYLATSRKSNACYQAINAAQAEVKTTGKLNIPLHLRNAPTKLMKSLGYGDNYQYAHNYDGNFIKQEFFPEGVSDPNFYKPQNNPNENKFKDYLSQLWGDKYNF